MTDEPGDDVTASASAALYGCVRADTLGQVVLHPTRDQYLATVKAMADDGYTMCVDLTAVDYLAFPDRSVPPPITAAPLVLR